MRKRTFFSSNEKLENAKRILSALDHVLNTHDNFLFCVEVVPPARRACPFELCDPSDPTAKDIVYKPKVPSVSGGISSLIGDLVHNLRTALNASVHSVGSAMGVSDGNGTWPVIEAREDLRDNKLKRLRKAFPDFDWHRFFLDELEIQRSSGSKIWELNQMDNLCKHESIIPALAISRSILNASGGNGNVSESNLVDSCVDSEHCFLRLSTSDLKSESHCDVKILCKFPDSFAFFQGEHVVDVLHQIGKGTYSAIRALETSCLEMGMPEFQDQWPATPITDRARGG